MDKIVDLNNDPVYLTWLHKLTVASYEKDIIIETDHADVVQYMYVRGEDIPTALVGFDGNNATIKQTKS